MPTLEQVKELRERTGCGIGDCQKALAKTNGDIEAAITLLRQQGQIKAAKKADRATKEGIVECYIHSNAKVGVLVSLLCETDFVARNERFKQLAHDIALHIAAADPSVIKPEDMPEDVMVKEREIAVAQAKQGNKPPQIQAKIIEGKLKSFREEKALMSQVFVKDPSKKVVDIINEAISELGENISVGQFCRIAL